MNKRNHAVSLMTGFLAAKTGALSSVPPSAHRHKGTIMLRSIGSVTFLALFMVGCGGGGGDSGSLPPPPAIYTVGGTVTGLSGPGLVLQLGGGADLPISASGAFTFPTPMPSGASYAVTVKSSPTSPLQACTVAGGVGTIAATNVTNVDVSCTSASGYTVGGTVSGLVGSGLTLAICRRGRGPPPSPCRNLLQVATNGAFTLGVVSLAGSGYASDRVEVTQQPSSPTQRCAVGNPMVENQIGNSTSLTVSCAEYSYVLNTADDTISAYTVDATTGALAPVDAPIATGASPSAIVGTSDKRFVFVANAGSNDVSAFTVNPTTGALTAIPGSPIAAGVNPQAILVIDAVSGPSYLLVANAGSDNTSVYQIDLTGALTLLATGAPNPAVKGPGSAFGAGGMFLYTANPDSTNPSISGFSVGPGTGQTSPLSGSPFPLPVSHNIAADQTGAYLYVTSGASILGYGIDASTGALTALPGFPVAAGANAYSLSIDSTNRFLYAANDGAANISGFRLDASTGALTPIPGSPFPGGNHPEFIATF